MEGSFQVGEEKEERIRLSLAKGRRTGMHDVLYTNGRQSGVLGEALVARACTSNVTCALGSEETAIGPASKCAGSWCLQTIHVIFSGMKIYRALK